MGVPTMLVTLFGHLDIEIQVRSYTHASYSHLCDFCLSAAEQRFIRLQVARTEPS